MKGEGNFPYIDLVDKNDKHIRQQMTAFTHLHVHSHYSILDGMSKIEDLIEKATANGMYSMALTDHGNMFGIKDFFDSAEKYNSSIKTKIKEKEKVLADAPEDQKEAITAEIEALKKTFFKPIFGCEAYVARQTPSNPTGSRKVIQYKENQSGYHLILLAKNQTGYKNLCQIISKSWTEGYYNRPRIDRELLEEYSEGLIVASACLAGELNKKIENGDINGAREAARWYKTIFGDDYYIELQRHKTDKQGGDTTVFERQSVQNEILVQIAAELGIELIATNDVHFVNEEDAEAHDRLICLSTQKTLKDTDRLHYTKQEWLKTPDEMAAIFPDYPQALANTMKIAEKVENYSLNRGAMMPAFDIPEEFGTEQAYREKYSHEDLLAEFEATEANKGTIDRIGGFDKAYRVKLEADYLRYLTLQGAHQRYGEVIPEDKLKQIDFELDVIHNMGFPGYFLIVQDFIQAARNLGVSVGPGRGSAAGSLVAYCLKITDIDPTKYDLLFERFLNPDRISLPDIDIDFDDDGRVKVLDWVTNKYGADRVAHIITFGTMATKSSIKDVARVQDYPLQSALALTNLVPDKFPEDAKTKKTPKVNMANCLKFVPEFKNIMEGDNIDAQSVLKYASILEGTIRQIGVHACGVIIGSENLALHAPLATVVEDKKTNHRITVTEYEGSVVESVGLIKMDFLGLTTLSIIKETLRLIKETKNIDLDINAIPLDDKATYDLYSTGNTVAVFQFESAGMQKYLKELVPSRFEDLIAMNALYRPGPMDYIPQFIARKQGREPIKYDIDIMEKYLSDTYGITVYQEQVMLLSRLLANFTRGESDTLRKAMGKKQIDKMMKLKDKFMEQGMQNGHDQKILEKIWADWEKFASYAFNKSHATCYSWVSYQTAYLKAHYPVEFMAANLTTQLNKMDELKKLLADCKKNKIKVLGPDINESSIQFSVNKKGEIRFGLAAIKGVGASAVEDIIKERQNHGPYTSILDFFQRINPQSCNKKMLESLVKAGAFDSFSNTHRAQFFVETDKTTFLEKLIKYAVEYRRETLGNQQTLFDDVEDVQATFDIQFPHCDPWTSLHKLQTEKEVLGCYITGHPLDDYYVEINSFYKGSISDLSYLPRLKFMQTNPIKIAGIITSATLRTTNDNKEFMVFKLEDYEGEEHEFRMYKETCMKYKHLCVPNIVVGITLKSRLGYGKKNEKGVVVPLSGDDVNDYYIDIMNMELLEDVANDQVKTIEISVLSSDVDSKYVENIKRIVKKHRKKQGKRVEFIIFDEKAGRLTMVMHENVEPKGFCYDYGNQYSLEYIRMRKD